MTIRIKIAKKRGFMKKMKKTLKTVELKTLLTNFKSNEKFSRKGIVLVSYSVHDNV